MDREIEVTMLRLLAARGPGGLLTLSESALAVGGDGWRGLLDRIRRVAARLVGAGLIEFVWQGRVVDPWDATTPALIRLTRGYDSTPAVTSRLN
ncbi:MAG: DUF3253 domain-containing protein [Gemmatimonadetes bacterium]|uniref:DUF3253 domain-containing protein n=1 Tax=Candidatus Kutchimonas denitrificans TaxID=3056748 RepID=A0AAE5CC63_9BACT|nr:DUF3253 domain-containing protein [Gemmatimonadota bacterium]NIR76727.1 DUF3253 domain-containing protein [Candidatus Kutchimonas denitrificans]NIS01214.1 DUF3253 domain-containing protein [Gemmatimonadota bacterium]NIT68253.1 DUF3253 domain-containing protein [Gemmatimonadota bacterium]NIW75471.1 DUF3253 domain-containing protein [Gemmatimonadota bacterium]